LIVAQPVTIAVHTIAAHLGVSGICISVLRFTVAGIASRVAIHVFLFWVVDFTAVVTCISHQISVRVSLIRV
jgi:hypothetical protein